MRTPLLRALAPLTLLLLTRCATPGAQGVRPVEMPTQEVQGDLALARMNDEELFAAGSSAFAAGDARRAAACFERLVTSFPESPHLRQAHFSAGLALERLQDWDGARRHFIEVADAAGTGDALDAAFHHAETLYHLERYPEAIALLGRSPAELMILPAAGWRRWSRRICQESIQATSIAARRRFARCSPVHRLRPSGASKWTTTPGPGAVLPGRDLPPHCEAVTFDPRPRPTSLPDLEYRPSCSSPRRATTSGRSRSATATGPLPPGAHRDLYEVLHKQMMESPTPRSSPPRRARSTDRKYAAGSRSSYHQGRGVYEIPGYCRAHRPRPSWSGRAPA